MSAGVRLRRSPSPSLAGTRLEWLDPVKPVRLPHGEWHDLCACKGNDLALFFSDQRGSPVGPAMELCSKCPVSRECIAHALQAEEFGVWAGTTGAERRRLRTVLGIPFDYSTDLQRPRKRTE